MRETILRRGCRLGVLLALAALGWATVLPAGDEVLTNKNIIELIKAGIGADLIAKKVTTSETAFDMSSAAMIDLKQNNVPDPIIDLMLQEYKKTQKKTRARIALEIQNLASENPEVQRRSYSYLRALDTAALPQIVDALGSNVPAVRAAAAKALGDFADKSSVTVLRPLLTDPDQVVRFAAAYSLNLLRDEESLNLARRNITAATGPLDGFLKLAGLRKDLEYVGFISVRLLKDTDTQTRAQAAWALGEIGSERGVAALEDALVNDREVEVKKEAAAALGKIKSDTSFDKLADICRRYPPARRELLAAIGNYPVQRSAPFLIAALGQPLTAEQKTEVLNSLRRLTGRDYGEELPSWKNWLAENKITGTVSAEGSSATPNVPAATPATPAANAPAAPAAGAPAADKGKGTLADPVVAPAPAGALTPGASFFPPDTAGLPEPAPAKSAEKNAGEKKAEEKKPDLPMELPAAPQQ